MPNSDPHSSLGRMLKEHRKARGLTLRQVEEATNISNAYLSQIENDKIQSPSANYLYKLANLYRGDFDFYLEIAGIIEKRDKQDGEPKSLEGHVLYAERLSEYEEKQLLKYLQFLRFRKNESP